MLSVNWAINQIKSMMTESPQQVHDDVHDIQSKLRVKGFNNKKDSVSHNKIVSLGPVGVLEQWILSQIVDQIVQCPLYIGLTDHTIRLFL